MLEDIRKGQTSRLKKNRTRKENTEKKRNFPSFCRESIFILFLLLNLINNNVGKKKKKSESLC